MSILYSMEENVRILISLLKQHEVRKVIASPGTKNISLIGSIQNDPFFEIYSAVDERSAAYMACGLAAESKECVCLSCTGATASRNYIPGLTEAYYRKLPIIAITSTSSLMYIGHNKDQVIDRRNQLNDIVYYSAWVPSIRCDEERWQCEIEINKALIYTRRHGGGPVHINIETLTQRHFTVSELKEYRKIDYFTYSDENHFPVIPTGRTAIFIGNHEIMTQGLTNSISEFCKVYDAVVFCDRTSNYFGEYRVVPSLVIKQDSYKSSLLDIDLLIHIGHVSGSQFNFNPKRVWRINPDGEIRDTFKKLSAVFELSEEYFFEHYSRDAQNTSSRNSYLNAWKMEVSKLHALIPELPFSNLWIAQNTISQLPEGSVLHLGILNTLRSWDYFDSNKMIPGFSNTGGFGIDGCLSSCIGGALSNSDILHFIILGDLAFFYDMNSLGNRHASKNLRIMLINNGRGMEFRKYNHPGSAFGEQADLYIAAAGHYGNQSKDLVKHYTIDLGFNYMYAADKQEFISNLTDFISSKKEKPILFEVFTDYKKENEALKTINNLLCDKRRGTIKIAKSILGDKRVKAIKDLLHE